MPTKVPARASNRTVTRIHLQFGELYADILTDFRDSPPLFIYVVQRHGSAEILAMGGCNSEEEATACATNAIEQFRSKGASA